MKQTTFVIRFSSVQIMTTQDRNINEFINPKLWTLNFQQNNSVMVWVLFQVISANKRITRHTQAAYVKQYNQFSPQKQSEELQKAGVYLKQKLKNSDRKALGITDAQWNSWQCMFFVLLLKFLMTIVCSFIVFIKILQQVITVKQKQVLKEYEEELSMVCFVLFCFVLI